MPARTLHLSLLLLLTLLLAAAAYLLRQAGVQVVHPYIYYILLFLFLVASLTSFITTYTLQQDAQKFVTGYLASMVVRLLLSFGGLLLVFFMDLPDKMHFVLNFAVAYLIFLVFEIYTLLTTLRANSEKGTEHVNQKTR